MRYHLAILGISFSLLCVNLPVHSETCTPIPLVGGQGNEVTKTVDQPTIQGPLGITITRSNYNTDWAVPGDAKFSRYIVTVTSNDEGPFDMRMYLKYSDQTSDQFYNNGAVRLTSGKPLELEAAPRSDNQPYQVNLYVNGLDSIGKTYTASAVGCR